jgi:4-hydroxymandelate oxidase
MYLSRAERMEFAGSARVAADPEHRAGLRRYLSDMVRPYGAALSEESLASGAGHSYGEMAAALIGATVPRDQPVDLLVLAFAVPDIRPGRATATYLSQVCPGRPLAFAISDQGGATAFTGLRLIREYARDGRYRRALLLVVEQSTLHYEPVTPAAVPARHRGVALLCDGSGGAAPIAVRQHTNVDPAQVDRLLTTELARAPGRAAMTVILGGGLTTAEPLVALGRQVHRAPPEQPYTGIWWELAGALSGPVPPRLVTIADYDPMLRYLCLSTIDTGRAATADRREPSRV